MQSYSQRRCLKMNIVIHANDKLHRGMRNCFSAVQLFPNILHLYLQLKNGDINIF